MMTAFETAERAAIAQVAQRPGSFDQLINSRDYPVQTPEIITRHSVWAEKLAHMGLRRTAILLGPSGLARMQANRISPHDHKSFASEAEARIWLQEP